MVRKVKYIGSNVWSFMTLNKIYDVIDETFGEIEIADDDGDEFWFTKDNFETIEERSKTLLEYFMELHDLKEGEIFKINYRNSKIKDNRLFITSDCGDYWVEAEYPLHFYNKAKISKNET